jgi:RNA polymerase sigma-70 factor (ECF subfamily)
MYAEVMEPAQREDASLVEAALDGDSRAFEELVRRYQERIFGLLRHYTRSPVEIEDLAQDTFLKAYTRLDSFGGQSSFYTWLYRIALNTALDFLKRKGRSPVQAVDEPEDVGGAPRQQGWEAPDARMQREEIARITHAVLEALPEIFRTVLVLREFEDLSYQEIADMLGISIGTVESRLFRARARFREKLVALHPELGMG